MQLTHHHVQQHHYPQAPLFLKLLHQDPQVIHIAADYCMRYIPSLLAAGVSECVKRYMVAQNLGTPVMLATLIPTLAAPPTLWLLVRHWGMGLAGVAMATVVWHVEALLLMVLCMMLVESSRGGSQRCVCGGVLGCVLTIPLTSLRYIPSSSTCLCPTPSTTHRSHTTHSTWTGFSPTATTPLSVWAPYLAVAGPSCLLLTLDWGIGEAAGFLAGMQGDLCIMYV